MSVKKLLTILLLALGTPMFTIAQVTSSGLSGVITNNKNEPLGGATIKAIHTPTGTSYSSVSRPDGQFNISNMRVGGPYKIEISYVGYNTKTIEDVSLQLGEPMQLKTILDNNSQSLNEVVVTGNRRNALISPDRSGASTNISHADLTLFPTISRNIDDFTRLVPQAQGRKSNTDGSTLGVSFAGVSNKYNQFTIDGANATDVFGLAASGTNGGQASLNPIPFDAIEQVQIILDPYDVTLGGFTGGGVNAVTRSGTNTMHGSAFGFNQNNSFVGDAPGTGVPYGKFHDWNYGANLGGAFIPNKLFYFVDYEGERRSAPISYAPGTAQSSIRTSTMDSLATFLEDAKQHPGWSYDPGKYNGFNTQKVSDGIFARIDWNIDSKNKLTIRNNYVKGKNYVFSDATTKAYFQNNGYDFTSTTNSTVAELNSNISSRLANVLRATYTISKDARVTPGSPFPSVAISDNGATYTFGTDVSSQANSLDQNTFTITDNFNIYAGRHTITVGTDDEIYTSKNVFLQGILGSYNYNSLSSFYADASGDNTAFPTSYSSVYSTDPNNPRPVAVVHAGQFSLYAQDVVSLADNFKLTYGIRADAPAFFGKPTANPAFNSSDIAMANNVATNKVPKTAILLAPRVGFNWDVKHNRQTQIRGGIGIFTGRTPFVWISNQYSNTGVGTISGSLTSASAVQAAGVHFNPATPYQPAPSAIPVVINVTDQHYKYPKDLRANLAVDQRLPFGIVGTLEGIFTKTLQDINYHDLNLAPSTSNLVMGYSSTATTRPFYGATVNSSYSNVVSLGNTTQGYGYNITASLNRPFSSGWTLSLAYSLGHSFAVNNGTSSVALSNYRYAYNINGLNNLDLGRSNYDQGSRIVGYVGKTFKYGKIFTTSVGLVYTGSSGQTFSYVYYGDVNGDDGSNLANATKPSTSGGADLMYLPSTSLSDTAMFNPHGGLSRTQQFQAFQQYENSDKYLKKHVGKNTSINGDRLPWENHFDLKVAEAIAFYKNHTLTITADVLNIGNLLSKNWGRSYYLANQEAQPLDVDHFTKNANGTVTPYFYYTPQYGLNAQTNKPWGYSDYLSRFGMQLGLRYSF
jgi:hypothetical protein